LLVRFLKVRISKFLEPVSSSLFVSFPLTEDAHVWRIHVLSVIRYFRRWVNNRSLETQSIRQSERGKFGSKFLASATTQNTQDDQNSAKFRLKLTTTSAGFWVVIDVES
jgi:hypothetical protein